jgi:hypothetical protein
MSLHETFDEFRDQEHPLVTLLLLNEHIIDFMHGAELRGAITREERLHILRSLAPLAEVCHEFIPKPLLYRIARVAHGNDMAFNDLVQQMLEWPGEGSLSDLIINATATFQQHRFRNQDALDKYWYILIYCFWYIYRLRVMAGEM